MKKISPWLSIGFGIAAAAFWLGSAAVKIPAVSGPFQIDQTLTDTLQKSSMLSGCAAILTAISVFFQALHAILARRLST